MMLPRSTALALGTKKLWPDRETVKARDLVYLSWIHGARKVADLTLRYPYFYFSSCREIVLKYR